MYQTACAHVSILTCAMPTFQNAGAPETCRRPCGAGAGSTRGRCRCRPQTPRPSRRSPSSRLHAPQPFNNSHGWCQEWLRHGTTNAGQHPSSSTACRPTALTHLKSHMDPRDGRIQPTPIRALNNGSSLLVLAYASADPHLPSGGSRPPPVRRWLPWSGRATLPWPPGRASHPQSAPASKKPYTLHTTLQAVSKHIARFLGKKNPSGVLGSELPSTHKRGP